MVGGRKFCSPMSTIFQLSEEGFELTIVHTRKWSKRQGGSRASAQAGARRYETRLGRGLSWHAMVDPDASLLLEEKGSNDIP